MYLNAMDNAFAGRVDYRMLIKKYEEVLSNFPTLQRG